MQKLKIYNSVLIDEAQGEFKGTEVSTQKPTLQNLAIAQVVCVLSMCVQNFKKWKRKRK